MFLRKSLTLTITLIFSVSAYARSSLSTYKNITTSLVKKKQYFAALPLIKEILIRNRSEAKFQDFDWAIEQIIDEVGVKSLEVLPLVTLKRSSAPSLRYVSAKKLFAAQSYTQAIQYAKQVPLSHSMAPFALNLIASSYALLGQHTLAIENYRQCEELSDDRIGGTKKIRYMQLRLNKDYCLVGRARVLFAQKQYDKANLVYLDLEKSSLIWPEILFEEAWNAYYRKNYNRSLGKLVTYNAPLFGHVFNPEIDVLRALSYYRLCLYDDAKDIISSFARRYGREMKKVKSVIVRRSRNYLSFYQMMRDFREGQKTSYFLLNNMLASVERDPSFLKAEEALQMGKQEEKALRGSSRQRRLLSNVAQSIQTQKKIIGGIVRNALIRSYNHLNDSLVGMRYLKLEILGKKKRSLYQNKSLVGKRGEVKYIERTDKQYFWTFNGEFWADELGDYVFALGSRCTR